MTDSEVKNPFLSLKTRYLPLWVLVGSVVVAIPYPADVVVQYAVYGMMLLWAGWQIRRLGIDPRRLIGTLSRDSAWIPAVAVLVPVIATFSFGWGLLFLAFLTSVAPRVGQMVTQSLSLPVSWVLIVLVAPPVEELIFRGILLHRWGLKWGLTKAVLFSSLAFAILHANPIGMFVFGCVMAILYIKSRTLIVPVLCHSLNNAIAFALSASPAMRAASFSSVMVWAVPGALVSGACLFYFLRRNWSGPDWRAPYFAASESSGAAEAMPAAGAVEGEAPAEPPGHLPHDLPGPSEPPPAGCSLDAPALSAYHEAAVSAEGGASDGGATATEGKEEAS
jgi:uncharacterized protein